MSQNIEKCDLQLLRQNYIRALAEAENKTEKARQLADDLFYLDLTVYSQNFSFKSILFNSFSKSILDDSISLHPEQLELVSKIEQKDALIISAPTSFGKTFCIFEYIAKNKPKNIVLVVPTLALVDEYRKKIIKRYKNNFLEYKIHTNIDEKKEYDFNQYNMFILTHDRVVQENNYILINEIDFLVIDEVYKLETDMNNDRVLVLNMAYYYMAEKSKKYVLLAPFIKEVNDMEKLNKKPELCVTEYSPVINDIEVMNIIDDKDREQECKRILDRIDKQEKTLIYFPTVTGIYKYIKNIVKAEPNIDISDENTRFFIEWAKEEIHEEWGLIAALERGYLIHNGQMPIGSRLFQMDSYEKSDTYNRMLCTSTLLEGVNTTAKNIVITKASRQGRSAKGEDKFSAFDFYNLVGRTGRLYQHYLGKAYYIKAPNDVEYSKKDAIRSIKFEITDESKDIDIQLNRIDQHKDILEFFGRINITIEDYKKIVGGKIRFDTVKGIYDMYVKLRKDLLNELSNFLTMEKYGRNKLVNILYNIINGKNNKLESMIINELLNKGRPRLKTIINKLNTNMEKIDIDYIITSTIRLKMGYIEHEFYARVLLVKFFLENENVSDELIKVLHDKIISSVEQLYFSDSLQKKMLMDMGIYERDIEKIIKIIGDDYEDVNELKSRLTSNINSLKGLSFISNYVIKDLI